MAITKRSDKGSALTYNEMDDNFDAIAPRTSATGSVQIPAGDTASRDGSPQLGYFRYNTSLNAFEGYQNGSWQDIGGAGGGDVNQNAFSIITIAGQTNVSADAATDTLNLIAGTGVTLTTDAGADSITISATGGGLGDQDYAYSSLTGVPTSFPPSAHNQAWSTITSTPTTLAGYGITDGATGTQGIQGVEGPEGMQGADGDIGAQGTNGIGLSGNQGVQGIQGEWVGILGPQGVQGDTGAGTQGTTGSTGFGVQGLQGSDGTQGTLGTTGDPGDLGTQGVQGAAGSVQGMQGTQGDVGPIGNDGEGFQGIQGSLGIQGDVGIQGDLGPAGFGNQGIQGVQGDLGPEGIGTQGVQGLIGPQSDIQGVQGLDGEGTQGIQGTVGADSDIQGVQGVNGVGDTGAQGFQGIQGTGQTGSPGNQGTQGVQGIQGTEGNQGLTGFGEAGIQGDAGEDGAQGISGVEGVGLQGFQGTQGVQGLDGTGIQGVQGFQGFQGTQGVQGMQGDLGVQGETGSLGGTGLQGNQGTFGLQGTQSVQGLIGPTGVQGTQGTIGIQGVQGDFGLQGMQGTTGIQGDLGFQGVQGSLGPVGIGIQGVQGDTGIQGIQGVQGLQSIQGLQGIDNGLTYASFSATNVTASGDGSLGYNANTGVFEYTPAVLGTAAIADTGITTGTIPFAEDVVLLGANNNVSIAGLVTADGLVVDGIASAYNFSAGTDPATSVAIVNNNVNSGTGAAIVLGSVYSGALNVANARIFAERQNTGATNAGATDLIFEVGQTTGSALVERMRIDSDGKTTLKGDILVSSDDAAINLRSGAAGTSGSVNWTFNTDSTSYAAIKLPYDTRASVGLHFDVGYPITIDSSSSTGIKFLSGTTENVFAGASTVFNETGADVDFRVEAVGNSHALFIDGGAGNLLVAKTALDVNVVGHELRASGYSAATRDAATVGSYTRLTDSGTILEFRQKNGVAAAVTVGSWLSRANTVTSIVMDHRANNDGFGIGTTNSDALVPTINTGALVNGTKDLGEAATQWRNLYLSGSQYLGGATTRMQAVIGANGGGIFSTISTNDAQTGILYANEHGTNKFCVYAITKQNLTSAVSTYLIANDGLYVNATNAGGTIALLGYSVAGSVRMFTTTNTIA